MTNSLTCGVHHVGLSVPDLDATRDFFCQTLGWKVVGEVPDYPAVFVSDGAVMLTLWRVADPDSPVPFDRRSNIGLHHLALAVEDEAGLERVYAVVRGHPDVAVEFAPGPIREGSTMRHFICSIPGGIRVEFATRAD
jgi:catechol 2,3-dioxygenase-like lactoylglutathione lyase family enzyme